MMREGLFEHHRLDTVQLPFNASNVVPGLACHQPVPQGYAWYIENLAYLVIGNSHTTVVEFAITPDDTALPAETGWDGAGLVWTNGTGAAALVRGAVQPGLPWYVAPGHALHVQAHAGTAVSGDILAVTFQVAVHSLDVQYMMSPEDTKQLKERHERMAAGLNMDAVGERAN
jgi:hypothetical protein